MRETVNRIARLLPPARRLGVAYCRFVCVALAGTLGLLVAAHAQSPGTAPPAATQKTPEKAAPDGEKCKRLLAVRREYQHALESLREHYIEQGDVERAKWAEEELIQFHRIQKHAFLLDLEVPGPGLKASVNIPQANDLFKQAMGYKDKGWMGNEYLDNHAPGRATFSEDLDDVPGKQSHQ